MGKIQKVLQSKKLDRSAKTFLLIFIFTIFSGVLRKWIFIDRSVGNFIFFIQIIIPYLFLSNESFKTSRLRKIPILVIFFLYLLIFAFNPLQKTYYHGLIGIVFHFAFWFLMSFYIANRESFDLRPIINTLVIIVIAEIILAFVQYRLPQTHFINRYAAVENVGNVIAEVGNAVRVTGSFSYISGFSAYLLFHVLFVWALIVYDYKPLITILLMIAGLFACFMNGSRGSTYLYLIILFFFLIFEAKKTNVSKHLGKLFIPVLLVTLLYLNSGSSGLADTFTKAYDNFQARRSGLVESGEEQKRIFGDFYALSNFKGSNPYFGIGIGAAYQGSLVLFGSSEALLEYGFVESELEKYVLEGGFILLLLRLLLTISICKQLCLPTRVKWLIGGLCFFTPIVYNMVHIVFFFSGIVFLDQMYYYKNQLSLKV